MIRTTDVFLRLPTGDETLPIARVENLLLLGVIWPLSLAPMAGSLGQNNLAGDYFPLTAMRPFLAKQNNLPLQSFAALRPRAVCWPRPPAFIVPSRPIGGPSNRRF